MKRILAAVLTITSVAAAGCSLDSSSQSAGQIGVVIGYQSKTINTVTAGLC